MAAPIDAPSGLVRAFAEFWLLPDLLALEDRSDEPPPAWAELLQTKGFNRDHVEDDDLPPGSRLPAIMAEDAWRAATWLELVGPHGLTDAGRKVARVAEFGSDSRTEFVWRPAEEVLARQIEDLYLGADGISIARIVQAGALELEQAQDEWINFCPGLLQIEFEALVHLAHTEPERAEDLVVELANNRVRAMEPFGSPLPDVVDLANSLIHADTVTEYYFNSPAGLIDESVLTVTAAQATLIFFVFCGLLEIPAPELPVQFLRAPRG